MDVWYYVYIKQEGKWDLSKKGRWLEKDVISNVIDCMLCDMSVAPFLFISRYCLQYSAHMFAQIISK